MTKPKYEVSVAHSAEQSKFVATVSDFEKKFDSGSAMNSTEIMNFLRDWLSIHILQPDMKCAKALNWLGRCSRY